MRRQDDEERTNKANRRAGEWLEALLDGRGVQGLAEGVLRDVRFKLPQEDDPMVLMIVRATDTTGRRVAFVGAGSVGQALLAWRKLDTGEGLRWREDKPWSGTGRG